jgi:hypothetical protein
MASNAVCRNQGPQQQKKTLLTYGRTARDMASPEGSPNAIHKLGSRYFFASFLRFAQ